VNNLLQLGKEASSAAAERVRLLTCVFQMYHFPANSLHYLLSLWQRMVAPVPYVKASEPHLLETYTPEVNKAYIMSRLDYVAVVLRSAFARQLSWRVGTL